MYPHLMQSAPGPHTVIDGRTYLYFAGTGYLALQGRPELVEAATDAIRRYGTGTATMRSGFGNSPVTDEVEALAARFFGCEASLYFASGYSGAAVLSAVLEPEVDVVYVDELSHFSVMDAVKLLAKPTHTFGHRQPGALEKVLAETLPAGGRPLVMSDGVFPVSGAIAPSDDYVRVLKPHRHACLMVDDAHAVATIGPNGRGSLEHLGLFDEQTNTLTEADRPRLLMCGTLSKAVGGFGGIVPGSRRFVESLARRSAAAFASSAPPAPAAGATARALRIVIDEPELRQRLHANVARLKAGLKRLGLATDGTPVPIVPVELESADRMRTVQQWLLAEGIAVAFSQGYSGIGPNGAIRIAVLATHTDQMIDLLLAMLGKALQRE